MEFTSIKQTLIGFTVFLTILAISSCAEESTAPPGPSPDYMSFTLTNRSGTTIYSTNELSRGSTYGLVITPASGAPISTADYVVTYTPTTAITTNVIRTNSVDFTVNNTTDTSVTVTVAHRTVSAISETFTLTFTPQVDYMSFTLTNASGATVDSSTTPLFRRNTYGLVITPGSGVMPATADYVVTYTPAAAITTNVTRTNSVDFTVNNNIADTTVIITVTHRAVRAVSETITLTLVPQITTAFQRDIENTPTVPNFATTQSPLTREVLGVLNVATGTTLEKRYVTETGGATTQDGSSWATAWAATNLRNGINAINDASTSKVYLIMVAGATYIPDYSTTPSRTVSFSMKNYVAIMGGFDPAGGWERTGITIFSGDIGTVGTTTDNSYHVFSHTSMSLGNAHLYGVIITNGNANNAAVGSVQERGAGMYNRLSSPVLTSVVFSGNTASFNGGGMFNDRSSPALTNVVFSGNTATDGGGMYNDNSSPVLTSVVFNGNSAGFNGGGMHNNNSSPVLTSVGFSGNTATFSGGGIYNDNSSPMLTMAGFSENIASFSGGGMYNRNSSSPVMTSVVFNGNRANEGGGMHNFSSSPVMIGAVFRNNIAQNGGGMFNDNHNQAGPLIVNSIFSGNTLRGVGGSGTNIAVNLDNAGTGTENIRIAGSVLGLGLAAPAQPTNAIVGYNGTQPLNISYHSLTNTAVRFGADATLTINGMNFTYPTTVAGSSAINLGLYVRRNGTTYYFSETEAVTSWHTGFTSAGGLDGTAVILPTTGTTEDLTATDIAGNARSGRPDAGVYELP